MKKITILLLITLSLSGCKTPSVTSRKLDRKPQIAIKGSWTLSAISYPGQDYIKVNAFDLAETNCFLGSNWNFISNNNKGNLSLNSGSCTSYTSPITWFVNKDGEFVMKILNDYKARRVREGYVLRVANQTESAFELIDKVNVGGKIIDITYQFQRN